MKTRKTERDRGDSRYSIPELAKKLGVCEESIYKGIAKGEIPCLRIGRRIILPKPMIDRWLEKGVAA